MLALARSETIMSGAYLYPFLVAGFYIVASPSGLGEGGGRLVSDHASEGVSLPNGYESLVLCKTTLLRKVPHYTMLLPHL